MLLRLLRIWDERNRCHGRQVVLLELLPCVERAAFRHSRLSASRSALPFLPRFIPPRLLVEPIFSNNKLCSRSWLSTPCPEFSSYPHFSERLLATTRNTPLLLGQIIICTFGGLEFWLLWVASTSIASPSTILYLLWFDCGVLRRRGRIMHAACGHGIVRVASSCGMEWRDKVKIHDAWGSRNRSIRWRPGTTTTTILQLLLTKVIMSCC